MENLVKESDITAAMSYFEARAGQRDGISICQEVSQLADVLGVMWHEKNKQIVVSSDAKICALLVQAGIELMPVSSVDAHASDEENLEDHTVEAP